MWEWRSCAGLKKGCPENEHGPAADAYALDRLLEPREAAIDHRQERPFAPPLTQRCNRPIQSRAPDIVDHVVDGGPSKDGEQQCAEFAVRFPLLLKRGAKKSLGSWFLSSMPGKRRWWAGFRSIP